MELSVLHPGHISSLIPPGGHHVSFHKFGFHMYIYSHYHHLKGNKCVEEYSHQISLPYMPYLPIS